MNTDADTDEAEDVRVAAIELGRRIEEVCNEIGTKARAAEVAGISYDQLHHQVKGRAKPGFGAMAKLCAAAGISLDWLATGTGERHRAAFSAGTPVVDRDLLAAVVEKTEAFLASRGWKATPEEKGRLFAAIYQISSEAGGKPPSDETLYAILGLSGRR